MLYLVYRHHEEIKTPPRKKFQSRSVALSEQDRIVLAQLSTELGKPQGEIARDAIRWYVENYKTASEVNSEDELIKAIYRVGKQIVNAIAQSTDKICKLLMRCTIDSNISMMLFFRMLPAAILAQYGEVAQGSFIRSILRWVAVDGLAIVICRDTLGKLHKAMPCKGEEDLRAL